MKRSASLGKVDVTLLTSPLQAQVLLSGLATEVVMLVVFARRWSNMGHDARSSFVGGTKLLEA